MRLRGGSGITKKNTTPQLATSNQSGGKSTGEPIGGARGEGRRPNTAASPSCPPLLLPSPRKPTPWHVPPRFVHLASLLWTELPAVVPCERRRDSVGMNNCCEERKRTKGKHPNSSKYSGGRRKNVAGAKKMDLFLKKKKTYI